MTTQFISHAVDGQAHLTITRGMAGWFAVHVWFNPELGGFWEPYNTGIGRYETRQEAYDEAKCWSDSDELPLVIEKDLT